MSIGKRLAPHVGDRKRYLVEKEAGVSAGYLTRLLADSFDNPKKELVQRICKVLGVDWEWVYFGRSSGSSEQAPRWRTYAAARPAFAREAAFALGGGYADDAILDAAVELLGDSAPTAAAARAAIVEAHEGVESYRSLMPGHVAAGLTFPSK